MNIVNLKAQPNIEIAKLVPQSLITQIYNKIKKSLINGDLKPGEKLKIDVLKEKNYSGWLVVEAEQDPAKANPFEYAKIGYKYLTETLNKSNLEVFQK